jgi:hypothetical protein
MPSTHSAARGLVIDGSPAEATIVARDRGRGFHVTAVPVVALHIVGR